MQDKWTAWIAKGRLQVKLFEFIPKVVQPNCSAGPVHDLHAEQGETIRFRSARFCTGPH